MPNLTENDPRLQEHMAGYFYDAFRAVGASQVTTSAMEKLRTVGVRMANAIEHAAERKAIQVIKKLQKAVSKSFESVAEDVEALTERVAALEARLPAANAKPDPYDVGAERS